MDFSSSGSDFASVNLTEIHAAASAVEGFVVFVAVAAVGADQRRCRCWLETRGFGTQAEARFLPDILWICRAGRR